MAISSGNSATAADFNSLKAYILTLFSNRTIKVDNRTLSDTSAAPYSTVNALSATQGASISSTQKELINAVLVINDIPNLITQAQGGKILADGTTTEVINWVVQYYNQGLSSSTHGCRGACVGLCSGGCAGGITGWVGPQTSGYGPAGPACTNNTCNYTCTGGCYTCTGSCTGSCNGCSGTCGNGCNSACQNTCKNGCATTCDTGCFGSAKNGTYT